MARHPRRPYTLDYIKHIFTDFEELAGDRAYADDKAIVGGIARLDGRPVMIIGHQKGRETKEDPPQLRYAGAGRLPQGFAPDGNGRPLQDADHHLYRHPGAYPGVGAEERGQSEAIARNLREMSRLNVPVICTVIGEGGSGGALAIGVGDKVNMLQYSTYSVISPEGCASILWKSADKAPLAAEAMGITAPRLKELKLIDSVIPEPLGSAHRDDAGDGGRAESAAVGRSERSGRSERRRVTQPSLPASDELRLLLSSVLRCKKPPPGGFLTTHRRIFVVL